MNRVICSYLRKKVFISVLLSVVTTCWTSTASWGDGPSKINENSLLSYVEKEANRIPKSLDDVDALLTDERIINFENRILSYANKSEVEFDGAKFEAMLDEIDSLPTDEAMILLVRLSDYYLGEAPGEILDEKITKIGERILPYLVQKSNMPINCKKEYNKLCYKNTKERNLNIRIAIVAIKKGIVSYAIFPENLDIEAKGYLGIIEIFLEDYKKKKGNFPKDLHELREYAWREYGYKLKVFNPWGQPYKYSLRDNDKYVLEIGDDNPYGWPKEEKESWPTSPLERKGR